MERAIVAEATEVVTVSPTYGEVLRSRGARRVSIVTNGFDPGDLPEAKIQEGTSAAYVGTYYPEYQDLATAFRALGSLARSGRVLGLRVKLVGNVPEGLEEMLVGNSVIECERTGSVPHKDALRFICEANVLLLSGPISAERDALCGHIPGKTFEYLGSGRPILLVGDPKSDVGELLQPLPSVRIVTPGDVEGAEVAFLSLLQGDDRRNSTQLERFTSRFLAGRLAETLDHTCKA